LLSAAQEEITLFTEKTLKSKEYIHSSTAFVLFCTVDQLEDRIRLIKRLSILLFVIEQLKYVLKLLISVDT
jgi:hypothetical protein